VARALNDHAKAVGGWRIAVRGVAYPGGRPARSPWAENHAPLGERGAELAYHDDHVPELSAFGLRSQALPDALSDADAVVIVTVTPGRDGDAVVRGAPITVDLGSRKGRGAAPDAALTTSHFRGGTLRILSAS